jgi:hypothetical protein
MTVFRIEMLALAAMLGFPHQARPQATAMEVSGGWRLFQMVSASADTLRHRSWPRAWPRRRDADTLVSASVGRDASTLEGSSATLARCPHRFRRTNPRGWRL